MAKHNLHEKLQNPKNGDDDEEEAESLSLSDLPIDSHTKETKEEKSIKTEKKEEVNLDLDFDFNFGTWSSNILSDSEMCVADEVFFEGQIRPISLSDNNGSKRVTRSESMEQLCSSSGLSSVSSRSSSSSKSLLSYGSTNSTSTNTNYVKSRVRNQFHAHPSPKPQIKVWSVGQHSKFNRKSSMWEIFRPGLVRTPEIELRDLKQRARKNTNLGSRSNSNNSNNSSTSSSSTNNSSIGSDDLKLKKQSKKQSFSVKDGSFFNGCKCSGDAIESAISSKSRILILKSKSSGNRNNESECETKVLLHTKQRVSQNHHKHRHDQNRTYEWLKELSIQGGESGLV